MARKLLALLMALAVLTAAAACSSDSGDESSDGGGSAGDSELEADRGDGSSSDDDTSSDDDSLDDDGSSSDDVPGLGDIDDFEACIEASAAYFNIVLLPMSLSMGASEEDIAELESELDELGADIPSELEDDFEVMADAFSEYAEALKDLDLTDPSAFLDESVMEDFENATAALETDEVAEAQENIEAYFEANCG